MVGIYQENLMPIPFSNNLLENLIKVLLSRHENFFWTDSRMSFDCKKGNHTLITFNSDMVQYRTENS